MVNAKPAGLPLKATKAMRPHLRDGGEEDPDGLARRSDLEGGDSLWSSHLSLLPLQADVRWRITVSEGWLAGEAWPPTVS